MSTIETETAESLLEAIEASRIAQDAIDAEFSTGVTLGGFVPNDDQDRTIARVLDAAVSARVEPFRGGKSMASRYRGAKLVRVVTDRGTSIIAPSGRVIA